MANSASSLRPEARPALVLDGPIVLLTVPKSGTHLITNLFAEIFGPSQVDGAFLTQERLDARGFQLENKVYHGHVPFTMANALRLRNAQKVLLHRDPRDICVSQVISMLEKKAPWGIEGEIMLTNPTFEELMVLVIAGGDFGSQTFPGIGAQLDMYYQRWAAMAHVAIEYRELLPDDDDWTDVAIALAAMLTRLGYSSQSHDGLMAIAKAGSNPARSATFSHGRAGRWRTLMSAEQLDLLRACVGSHAAPSGSPPDPGAKLAASAPRNSDDSTLRQGVARLDSLMSRIRTFDDCRNIRVALAEMPHAPVRLLIHTDGILYRSLQAPSFGADAFQKLASERKVPNVELGAGLWQPALTLVRELAKTGPAHFVDVGCYHGFESILVAAGTADLADRVRVTAYDCGIAGELAPINFEINGVADRVRFESTCIAECDRWAVMYGEYGHAENMRIVNRMPQTETMSHPVRAVMLDSEFDSEGDAHLVLSIDVSGAEALALRGAQQLVRSGRVAAAIVKFVPHALMGVGDPSEIHDLLGHDYVWYEIGGYLGAASRGMTPINGSFASFADEVARREHNCTKILAIRREFERLISSDL